MIDWIANQVDMRQSPAIACGYSSRHCWADYSASNANSRAMGGPENSHDGRAGCGRFHNGSNNGYR